MGVFIANMAEMGKASYPSHKTSLQSAFWGFDIPLSRKKYLLAERKVSRVGLVNLIKPVSWRAGLSDCKE